MPTSEDNNGGENGGWELNRKVILFRLDRQDKMLATLQAEQEASKEVLIEIRTIGKTLFWIIGVLPIIISVGSAVIAVWSATRK